MLIYWQRGARCQMREFDEVARASDSAPMAGGSLRERRESVE
jgi:hypothetical protein